LFSCKPSEATSKTKKEAVAHEPLVVVVLNNGHNGGFIEKENRIITSEEELKSVWNQAFKNYSKKEPLPEVDFSKNIVVLVALGERNAGGYSIKVKNAVPTKAGILVTVEETSPGKTCMLTTAMTYPYQIVQLNTTNKKITFSANAIVAECD
jgi:hypothetical protein